MRRLADRLLSFTNYRQALAGTLTITQKFVFHAPIQTCPPNRPDNLPALCAGFSLLAALAAAAVAAAVVPVFVFVPVFMVGAGNVGVVLQRTA